MFERENTIGMQRLSHQWALGVREWPYRWCGQCCWEAASHPGDSKPRILKDKSKHVHGRWWLYHLPAHACWLRWGDAHRGVPQPSWSSSALDKGSRDLKQCGYQPPSSAVGPFCSLPSPPAIPTITEGLTWILQGRAAKSLCRCNR